MSYEQRRQHWFERVVEATRQGAEAELLRLVADPFGEAAAYREAWWAEQERSIAKRRWVRAESLTRLVARCGVP